MAGTVGSGGSGGSSAAGAANAGSSGAGQAGESSGTPSGLIAYFAFEDTTEVAANDVQGAGNGSYHGTWNHPDGVRGKAVSLRNAADATIDWVELPDGLLGGRAEVTLSIWVRDLSTSRGGARLFGFTRGSGEAFFFCPDDSSSSTGSGAHLLGRHGASTFADLWTKTPLTDKAWHHVAVRWSASKLELFIDGDSAGSTDPGGVRPSDLGATSPDWLARTLDDAELALYGEIDELKLFDRALKASEIAAIYSAP